MDDSLVSPDHPDTTLHTDPIRTVEYLMGRIKINREQRKWLSAIMNCRELMGYFSGRSSMGASTDDDKCLCERLALIESDCRVSLNRDAGRWIP